MHSSMLEIPEYINGEGLIPFLESLAEYAEKPCVEINFSRLKRISPASMASIAAFVAKRRKKRLETLAIGTENCKIINYLRRMNLMRLCEWEMGEESFIRHDPAGSFLPLEPIHEVEVISNRIAACIAPGGDEYAHMNAGLYDAAFYLISEIANNVKQHSYGEGYVTLQMAKKNGFVKVAIADGGCGIPTSLIDAGLKWTAGLSDEDIIEQALVARVTSKGAPNNEGVGLTLTSQIVQLMGGSWLIASKGGRVLRLQNSDLVKKAFACGNCFPGTLVALTFKRSEASDFDQKLHKAKEINNLLQSVHNRAIFRP